ncbi:MAG: hypothetical protein ACE15E_08865 [Acidobacteriota bacterium]
MNYPIIGGGKGGGGGGGGKEEKEPAPKGDAPPAVEKQLSPPEISPPEVLKDTEDPVLELPPADMSFSIPTIQAPIDFPAKLTTKYGIFRPCLQTGLGVQAKATVLEAGKEPGWAPDPDQDSVRAAGVDLEAVAAAEPATVRVPG